MSYQMNLLFPKPESKNKIKRKKLYDNCKRKKKMRQDILDRDNYRCRAFCSGRKGPHRF